MGERELKDLESGSDAIVDDSDNSQVLESNAAKKSGHIQVEELPTKEEDIEAAPATALLDWDSLDDTENPKNWSLFSRCFHTAVPALCCFALTLGASTYVPAISQIQELFHVSRTVAILPLSLYTLGFTVGPIVSAPMSELYGRRIVYWTIMPILLIFIAISGAANSFGLLVAARFIAGFAGSGALAVGAGTIADTWDLQKDGGKASLCFLLAPFLGPVLGPLTGAYIIDEYHGDWRYSQWVILMVSAPMAIMACFTKETYKPRLLYLRSKKRGLNVGNVSRGISLVLKKLRIAVVRPLHMLTVEPLVCCISIYTGFAFAMIFSFLDSFNYVFPAIYNFDQKKTGLAFVGIVVGYVFGIIVFGAIDSLVFKKKAAQAKMEGKNVVLEHRLYAGMVGSVMLPAGLFWFAWSPNTHTHWIVPVLAGVPFGIGGFTIFLSCAMYLVDVYQAANAASALAANGIMRYGFSAIFPLFTVQMYTKLGIHWAGSVFAFVSLALMPVPWIFFWKGKELRRRSRYDTFKG